jgi:prepilin-type N-terminal cleavage/methylation domain-containing protein
MKNRAYFHTLRKCLSKDKGVTLIELMIGLLISSIMTGAAFHFYQAQHEMYLSQSDIADRQGNLRSAVSELSRQVRRAGYMVPGSDYLDISSGFDTLTVFVGQGGGTTVDTIQYFVDHDAEPPALVQRVNTQLPQIFADGIDTALFIPASTSPIRDVALALVSVPQEQYEGTALETRRRIGVTVHLRNRGRQ